jgi:hypothetical protein
MDELRPLERISFAREQIFHAARLVDGEKILPHTLRQGQRFPWFFHVECGRSTTFSTWPHAPL